MRGATGKPVAHHRTYELALPDGSILRTRISRPVDSTQYRDSIWPHTLRTQLKVTPDEFRECVTDNVLPQRSRPAAPLRKSLPLYLVDRLSRHGVPAQEISAMTEDEAKERLHQIRSEQG